MSDELDALRKEWDQKLRQIQQRQQDAARSQPRMNKLDELVAELKQKQRTLSELAAQRENLEATLQNDDSAKKDQEIQQLRYELANVNKQFLEIIEEKNRMYEDLTQ